MLVARRPAGETWTPVMGAKVLFAPIDRPMMMRARRAARETSLEDTLGDAEPLSALDMLDEMGDAMSRALITEGAKDWQEVVLQRLDDDGVPVLDDDENPIFDGLAFSAENLALVLSDPVAFEAFDAAYVVPFVMRERERAEPGNGSSASPGGTGGAAMPASNTASKAARPRQGGGAKSARTSRTSRKPRPRKASGGS